MFLRKLNEIQGNTEKNNSTNRLEVYLRQKSFYNNKGVNLARVYNNICTQH
jgi:hypothetical protein